MRKVLALGLSLALTAFTIVPVAADDLGLIGPGDRLHGADVSRWQHPNDKPINFRSSAATGTIVKAVRARERARVSAFLISQPPQR